MNPQQRRDAYDADVTYCTNKEVTADFLRDRLMLGRERSLASVLLGKLVDPGSARADRLVMRGMEYAIVDEADSVLIDEAVTPLIISGDSPNAESAEAYQQAAQLASQFEPTVHYRTDHRYHEIRLTDLGRQLLDQSRQGRGSVWAGFRRSEELVIQALTARDLYRPGKQYVVREGKVVIVDEFTGRLMPDRTWRDGLHQAVEAKEQLKVQPFKQTLARVSFQNFFRLYRRLAGMTGTAAEARAELWQIYRLPVVRIPTHRPCIRHKFADRIYTTADQRWAAIVEEIQRVHHEGRPVLIGTRSVQASEHLSALLTEADLDHQVLNAERHAEEAAIIAQAGQSGRITVATNMAGRGTDIKLGAGVAQRGGLHVIATERHEATRIDRQLFGRAARQGDPGSAIAIISLEDELIQHHAPKWAKACHLPPRLRFALAQRRAQAVAYRNRRGVLRTDDWINEHLAFAAPDG
jgi:preprotein translocase subunit SecA